MGYIPMLPAAGCLCTPWGHSLLNCVAGTPRAGGLTWKLLMTPGMQVSVSVQSRRSN